MSNHEDKARADLEAAGPVAVLNNLKAMTAGLEPAAQAAIMVTAGIVIHMIDSRWDDMVRLIEAKPGEEFHKIVVDSRPITELHAKIKAAQAAIDELQRRMDAGRASS